MPFAVAAHDGVLTLTLDTPASAVNIFNHATAAQLVDLLSHVTPATTRAIVFATAKPNSFINGVGLLLAQASRTHADVLRASTPPWTAYHAVREAPVPTIAVVQGNCFGCGVEFALNCDYRIASDSCETRFYMTELNDYLFIPLFGGTWNLPATVGLGGAIDLLLWGDRWDAGRAGARGLVDDTVAHEELAERTQSFVQRVLDTPAPRRRRGPLAWGPREDQDMTRARDRIASLPPQYHKVYTDALGLLEAGARQTHTYVDHQKQELLCSAASALSPLGKSAHAFFYLRQIASARGLGRVPGDALPVALGLDISRADDACVFGDDLRTRKVPGVTLVEAPVADFLLVGTTGERTSALPGREVAVRLALGAAPNGRTELYAPTYRAGGRLIELAIRSGNDLGMDRAARLTRTLQRFGFEVARTSPTDAFVSTRLLLAYLAPLVRFVARRGDATVVNGELRQLGFVRRPHDLLATLDRHALVRALAAELGRPPSTIEATLAALETPTYSGTWAPVVSDALCLSLLAAVLGVRQRGEVQDTSITDLIARELLDFPRHLCSLSSWLTTARVARACDAEASVRQLVTESALESARVFATAGREFYR